MPAALCQKPFLRQAASCQANCNNRRQLVCRAQRQEQSWASKATAVGAAALLTLSPLSGAALASEFDLFAEGPNPSSYVLDDANVINKTTKKSVGDALAKLESETGYRVEVATVRKLEFENDAFVFGDKLINRWYPQDQRDKKGVLIVVTSGKDGALTGGDGFMKAVGDDLIDSIISSNIPILTEEEKYNEAVSSSVNRVVAVLNGKEDPGAPYRAQQVRQRTYRTKEETEAKKPVTATVVLTLLFISVVVPMLQYFGYTNKD